MGTRRRAQRSTLASSGEVERLLASAFGTWRLDAEIQLPLLNSRPELRRRIEQRLNYLLSVCGCAEGSIGGAIAVVIQVATWLWSGDGFSLSRLFATVALSILAAMVVKTGRVTIAHIQARSVLRDILNAVATNHALTGPEAPL